MRSQVVVGVSRLWLLAIVLLGGIGYMSWYLAQPLPPAQSVPATLEPTLTQTPTPMFTPSATQDVAAMVNALVQTALASITPLATPTAQPTATPPVVGDLCVNRWTVSCPTNWAEVLAVWPQIAATYGMDFVLPVTEPQRKLVSGSWTMTFYPNGKQVVVVTPAREVWILGVHDVIKLGKFEFVIFVQCGNLAWRPIPPLVTPVISTEWPTSTSCVNCNLSTPTPPVIPTNTPCVTCNQATPTMPVIPTSVPPTPVPNTPVPPQPTATECPTCNLSTPTPP